MDIHPALLAPPAPPEPVSVIDVAEHILASAAADGADEMDTTRLQCLVYLSQGWHLAVTGVPLFLEPIEAWAEGPVVAVLAELYGDRGTVIPGFFYEKVRDLEPNAHQTEPETRRIAGRPTSPPYNPEGSTWSTSSRPPQEGERLPAGWPDSPPPSCSTTASPRPGSPNPSR